MPLPASVRTALKATGVALLAVVAGAVGGFFSQAYLEIWFDTVEVKLTDLSTWPNIPKGLSAKFDLTAPQRYRAYYGENIGDLDKPAIATADFVLRTFRLTGRVTGSKIKKTKAGDETYGISGYTNADHLVLTQLSPRNGVGNFFVNNTLDANHRSFYFGYFLTEDYKKAGGAEVWVTQCPFVMMSQAVAEQSYQTADAARSAFGFLRTKCIEFKLPASVNEESHKAT